MIATVLHRLRHGVTEKSSPFDLRSKWIYRIIAAQCLLAAVLLWVFGYSVDNSVWHKLPFAAIPLAGCGMLLRRYGHPSIGGALEVTSLTYLQGVATVFLLFPLTEISDPFADATLARMDEALGFHWPDLALVFAHAPNAYAISDAIYGSFDWQALVIVPLLFVFKLQSRAWRLVTGAAIAAVITCAIYPLIPGQGPAVQYGLNPADFPTYGLFPWKFGPDLAQIKEGGVSIITLSWVFGMVCLPSYHAASALLFAWAMWPLPWLRWLFLLLNIGVAFTAIYVGVHYLIDIIAGLMVAAISIGIAKRLV